MTTFNQPLHSLFYIYKNVQEALGRTKACLTLLLLNVFAFQSQSQAQTTSPDLTNCYNSCTAGDFTITKAYLSDINGVAITSSACTNPDAVVAAYITFVFTNTTNSSRDGIFVSGDVNGQHIFQCFPGVVTKKQSVTYTAKNNVVNWHCGTDLTLNNTFISWGSGGEAVCSITCSQATPSKCRTVGNVLIQTPLSTNFTPTYKCETGKAYQTVDFAATASGGDHSYTYSWNFGDGTAATSFSSSTTASHNYTSGGNFNVTLTVKDGTGTTKTATKSVTVASCCTSPSIDQQPAAQIKCEGQSASFTVKSSGGNPTPTVQWQISSDGTTWTNLTIASPYSVNTTTATGVTTSVLSISSTALTLNGKQYRAVFTSGVCTATNSNGALLTVSAIPAAPSPSNNGPICVGATLNLSTAAVSGATYSWTGPNSFQSSAQNPSIANATTAASGTYSLTITVSGCTSSPGSTTAVVNAIPNAPSLNDPIQPTCNTPTGTFTVKNYDNTITYTLTGPSPATTTQTGTNGNFSSLAPGSYSLTATKNNCTSGGTAVSINNAPGAPDAPVVTISQYPDCGSATGQVSVSNLTAYPGSDYEFSNNGTTWGAATTFTFTAGQGATIYVRRKSDNTCAASASCGNSQAASTSKMVAKPVQEWAGDKTKVTAAPNPFNSKIRFLITPATSGRGALELYNLLGQKVKTVFEGQVQKGQAQTIEYYVPDAQRTNLIYLFRVGNERASGKLIGLK